MTQNCPDCNTAMHKADDISCEKANWVCPECAPEFVLLRATTDVNEIESSDQWSEKYKA